MLQQLGHDEAATSVEEAVRLAIKTGETTPDLGGSRTTSQVGDYVARRVGSEVRARG
jgi:3-isopropylmalate dehydrogenase